MLVRMSMRQQSLQEVTQKHGDQKYGDLPYVHHLLAVAKVLEDFGYTSDPYYHAAIWHDSVEDTCSTESERDSLLTDIGLKYGDGVRFAVWFCTDEIGPSRKERKERTYDKWTRAFLASSFGFVDMAARVKLADRLANLAASKGSPLFSMYQKERESFRKALYVPGMADAMWDKYDSFFKD